MKKIIVLLLGTLSLLACHAKEKDNMQIDSYVYAVTEGDSLRMEVYTDHSVAYEGLRPCLFYVHGGGWDSDDNETSGRKWMRKMLAKGYVCVSIDYRQGIRRLRLGQAHIGESPNFGESYEYTIRIAVEDTFDATRFLLGMADQYDIDTTRIIAAGGSAGAINLITAEYWICNEEEIATSRLPEGFNYAAVIGCAGGVWIRSTKEPVWGKAPCPILFYHGDADQLVPYHHTVMEDVNFSAWGSAFLADQFDTLQFPYLFVSGKDCDHAMSGLPFVTNCDEMQSFLRRVVWDGEKLSKRVTETYLDEPRTIPYFLKHLEKYKDEL